MVRVLGSGQGPQLTRFALRAFNRCRAPRKIKYPSGTNKRSWGSSLRESEATTTTAARAITKQSITMLETKSKRTTFSAGGSRAG